LTPIFFTAEASLEKSYARQGLHDLAEYFPVTKWTAARRNLLSCYSLVKHRQRIKILFSIDSTERVCYNVSDVKTTVVFTGIRKRR
jgi:hypothetical protein